MLPGATKAFTNTSSKKPLQEYTWVARVPYSDPVSDRPGLPLTGSEYGTRATQGHHKFTRKTMSTRLASLFSGSLVRGPSTVHVASAQQRQVLTAWRISGRGGCTHRPRRDS